MFRSPRRSTRAGFTLLELLLALALTTIILLLISSGLIIHLRAFEKGEARVERAQIARVLLHHLSEDIRGVMPCDHPAGDDAEASSLAAAFPDLLAGSTEETESADETGSESSIMDLFGDDGAESEGDEEEGGESEETSNESTTEIKQTTPGVYGETDWLRIDVVRAPRLETKTEKDDDESAESTRVVREIKKICYYVSPHDATTANFDFADGEQPSGGLVRRELTRSVAEYASATADFEYQDYSIRPLAPQVTAIEFRYHDGSDWLDSWDTEEMGALPKAIEVRLFIAPVRSNNDEAKETTVGSDETETTPFRCVLRIPYHEIDDVIEPESEEDASTEGETSEQSGEEDLFGDSSEGSGETEP